MGADQMSTRPPRPSAASRPHVVDDKFQSDKYPTCPPGKVPLSVEDPAAQDVLWLYAQRRRSVDAAFSDDLEYCLRRAGYLCEDLTAFAEGELATAAADKFRDHLRTCHACREKLPVTLQLGARLSCLDARKKAPRRPDWEVVLPVLGAGTLLAMIAASLDAPAMTCSAIPLALFLGIRCVKRALKKEAP